MARCTIKLPEEMLSKISKLGDKTDAIVGKVLEAGGNVVLDKVRDNLKSVVGTGTKTPSRSTGELVSSLGLSPPKLNRDGNTDVKIGFREPRSGGGANAKIATVLEYGRHNQPPKPFMKPAKSKSRKAAVDAMKAKLEEEINNL
jgi:HK97 gp10 family phage protein